MLTDRYGLAVSTTSPAARDAYMEGVDLLLTVYPGGISGGLITDVIKAVCELISIIY